MMNRNQYNYLANLFRYPTDQYKEEIRDCYDFLKLRYPDASDKLEPFFDYVKSHSAFEIEEMFAKTFHIQAICYLDIGYVLFAEDYKRGEFLVQMKKEQEKANNDCGFELADNLPNVLTLIPLLKNEEFVEEFAGRILTPAIDKMLQEFDSSRMELKDKVRRKKQKVVIMEDVQNKNIFQFALEALNQVIKQDFRHVKYDDPTIVPTLGGHLGTVLSGNCGTSCAPPTTKPEVISK